MFLGPLLQEDEGLNMISLRKEIQGLNPEAPVALLHEMSQIASRIKKIARNILPSLYTTPAIPGQCAMSLI